MATNLRGCVRTTPDFLYLSGLHFASLGLELAAKSLLESSSFDSACVLES
jgi:hypothetical protein